jgi:hypothetical protein
VAEDFHPFDVNVTTKDPGVEALRRTDASDQHYGVRVVATQATDGFGDGIGGVAFLNSFPSSQDTPVFTFNKGARNGGMTSSHESGHALGLSHDGLNSQTYHPGTGSGPTGWGPIMGAPFDKKLTQWSMGEYAGATTTQDDLAIITKPANGFGYRPDVYGNTMETAHMLADTNGTIFQWGVIERNSDIDFFSFSTGAGDVSITILPFAQDPNLDILAKLYDENGVEIASSNPMSMLRADFNQTLAAGTYFLSVDGTELPGRYTDYGSLGYFAISAEVVSQTLSGDFNNDGAWNILDLDLLVADIVNGGTPSLFDVNNDGLVNNLDTDWWLVEAGAINLPSGGAYLRGDANLDGAVEGSDFGIWNSFKFSAGAAWSRADFNADGTVDGSDFGEWNLNKFQQSIARNETPALDESEFDSYPEYVDPFGEPVFWPLGHSDQYELGEHEGDVVSLVQPSDRPIVDASRHQAYGSELQLETDMGGTYRELNSTNGPRLRLDQFSRTRMNDSDAGPQDSRSDLAEKIDSLMDLENL